MIEGRRVLVVEDDPGVADVISYRLSRCGVSPGDVALAPDALAAMEALDRQRFDLVLLDQRLPQSSRDLRPSDETGRELLRYVRRRRPELPVIVMTAYVGLNAAAIADTPVQLMKLGARDFIRKPFEQSPESLEDKISAALVGAGSSAGATPLRLGDSVRHHVRIELRRAVEVDGIRIEGEVVAVFALLRDLFLDDQRNGLAPEAYRRLTSPEIAARLAGVDEYAVRQRILSFRNDLAAAYRARHGRDIDRSAIIENVKRAGYRLCPRTVVLLP